jgi:hypothetical protein
VRAASVVQRGSQVIAYVPVLESVVDEPIAANTLVFARQAVQTFDSRLRCEASRPVPLEVRHDRERVLVLPDPDEP